VRQLAEAMGVPDAILRKAPSADLWPGQTDETEVGFSYATIDRILFRLVDGRRSIDEIVEEHERGRPVLVGTTAGAWCPSSAGAPPPVWVCVTWSAATVEVRVGGSAPALLPLLPGSGGLPLGADVALARETFR